MRRKKLFKLEKKSEYHYIVSKEQPLSYVTEAFQKALLNLEFVMQENKYKVIQFTSSLAGSGKTTFVSNLAYLLGNKGKKVVLVDLDLRKPKVNRVFGVANEDGISDYLYGGIDYQKLVRYDEKLAISYIVAGEKTSTIVNLLESKKIKELFKQLKEDFDYVIVDTPPVLAVSDSLYIAKLVDGVVFVVAQNEARRKVINEAVATLRQSKVNILGTILTQVDSKDVDMYSYSYGYEGKY